LRSFPFDRIKIDQSFVRDLVSNREAVAIVRAVTGLANSLGIKTTAEGVETLEQLNRLREEGCTEVQGYFFSRPQPASELPLLLKKLHSLDCVPDNGARARGAITASGSLVAEIPGDIP
jgi:EAL domain-containing protein (putative c-di-GMP-specific phosphodiesterase class I)